MHLDPGTVRPRLLGAFGREQYLWAESCPSTQRLPADDAPHGTVATLAGPLGFVVAGEALSWISTGTLFLVVASGLLALGLVFAGVVRRHGRSEGPSVPVPA